jgi:uncharacterized protein YjiK
MTLDHDLNEISGLSYYDGKLYAVQDELGTIYALNSQTGEILGTNKCWKNGDFEAIEVVDGRLFMLKSNGNLYETPIEDMCRESTRKIDLGFDKDWNFEGLGYNPFNKSLVLVAKRSQHSSKNEIFCLPIDDVKIIGDPCYVIQEEFLKAQLSAMNTTWSEKMVHKVSYSFNPSGIAVHPETGEIYILSSPSHQLLILTNDWKFKKILKLKGDMYKQPESICFDNELNLYIGNEARKGNPTILKFHPK